METEPDQDKMLQGLIEGDDQAYERFWSKYGERLQNLAQRHLPEGLHRRLAPEDVVQSACRSFYRRATSGKLQLEDAEKLWHLLCVITINKVNMQVRYHLQQKRAANRERTIQSKEDSESPELDPPAKDPAPDELVMFTDEFQRIMSSLAADEQELIKLKLEDRTNESIAAILGCSERTVRRLLNGIRSRLKKSLPDLSSAYRDAKIQ